MFLDIYYFHIVGCSLEILCRRFGVLCSWRAYSACGSFYPQNFVLCSCFSYSSYFALIRAVEPWLTSWLCSAVYTVGNLPCVSKWSCGVVSVFFGYFKKWFSFHTHFIFYVFIILLPIITVFILILKFLFNKYLIYCILRTLLVGEINIICFISVTLWIFSKYLPISSRLFCLPNPLCHIHYYLYLFPPP